MKKFDICLTRHGFKQKPSSDRQYVENGKPWVDRFGNPVNEYMAQSMTITKNVKTISLLELAQKIETGHAWVGALFHTDPDTGKVPRRLGNWKSQSFFAADLDNGTIDPETAYDRAVENGWEPAIIHHTFSSTDDKPKLRVIFVVEEPIEDVQTAKAIWFKIGQTYEGDTSASDIVKIYQGGKPGCVTYFNPNASMSIEDFGELPDINKDVSPSFAGGADFRASGDQEKLYNELEGWHRSVMKNLQSTVRKILRDPHSGQRVGNKLISSRYMALFTASSKLGQCPYFYLDYAKTFILNYISSKDVWLEWDRDWDQICQIIDQGLTWGRDNMRDYDSKYEEFKEKIKCQSLS